MTMQEMVEQVNRRIENSDGTKFSDSTEAVVDSINNASVYVSEKLMNRYVEPTLACEDTGLTVTSVSANTGYVDLSDLTYDVLKGKDGILAVKVNGGVSMVKGDCDAYYRDVISAENGISGRPAYYLFDDQIRVVYTSAITEIDVLYLRVPIPNLYEFPVTQLSAGASTTQFSLDTFTGIAGVDDVYNGVVIYHTDNASYHVITDYDYAGGSDDRLVTVSPASASAFTTGDTVRFITDDFKHLNLSGVTVPISKTYHDVIVGVAASELWNILGRPDRAAAEMQFAVMRLQEANEQALADLQLLDEE